MSQYTSPSADEHRREAPRKIRCAVLTISDTRSLASDRSGALVGELLEQAGHDIVDRTVVLDEPPAIEAAIRQLAAREGVEAILATGGTGIASRDRTPETVARMLTTELPGFGELFRMLSFQEIGAAAMLSRAIGGLVDRTIVLAMPGSPAAVRLAMKKLIVPELAHMVAQAQR